MSQLCGFGCFDLEQNIFGPQELLPQSQKLLRMLPLYMGIIGGVYQPLCAGFLTPTTEDPQKLPVVCAFAECRGETSIKLGFSTAAAHWDELNLHSLKEQQRCIPGDQIDPKLAIYYPDWINCNYQERFEIMQGLTITAARVISQI